MDKKNNNNKIKDYPLIELNIDDIKKDKSNPNVMTLEQSQGLEKSLTNFGRLKFIVVDQHNVLIDGEHRLEIEKANGTKKLKVIQVKIKDEVERKILRETLNKLHGEYNKQKESDELLAIHQNNRLEELAELLGKPNTDEFMDLIQKYHTNDELGSFESTNINEFDNVETNTKCPKCGYEW